MGSSNPFDQFDAPASTGSGNPFDRFEQASPRLSNPEFDRIGQFIPSGEKTHSAEGVNITRPDIPQPVLDVATGMSGLMRGAGNLVSKGVDLVTPKNLSDVVTQGQPQHGLGDILWPKARGSAGSGWKTVGEFADPVAWSMGAAIAKALPYVPVMSKLTGQLTAEGIPIKAATSIAEKAIAIAKNAASGALAGGSIAGLSDEGDAAKGAAWGAAINTLLPPALSAVGNAASFLKNKVYPSPGSIGVTAAGDKADEVINALRNTQSGVPGVNLNAGQASVPANSAEFAALQKTVAETDPSRYFGPGGNKGQQEAARLAAVQKIGNLPEWQNPVVSPLEAATKVRSAKSAQNYGEAFKTFIKDDPKLEALSENPYFNDEVGEALKLAKANGIDPAQNLTQLLHYVKEGLDARIASSNNPNAPAISNAAKGAIQDVKTKLVDWLANANPAYDAARVAHIEASQPINQMRVGQDLERALSAPATGAERASSFGTTVRNAETKISKASGKPLIEHLTPEQKQIVGAIGEDFKRNADYKALAAAGRGSLENRIGSPEIKAFGMFNPWLNLARGKINEALGTGHEMAIRKLVPIMENPQEMARLMEQTKLDVPAMQKLVGAIAQGKDRLGILSSVPAPMRMGAMRLLNQVMSTPTAVSQISNVASQQEQPNAAIVNSRRLAQ